MSGGGREDRKGVQLTWLDCGSNLISSTSEVLTDDLSGGLLALRSELLLGLLAESLASGSMLAPNPGRERGKAADSSCEEGGVCLRCVRHDD